MHGYAIVKFEADAIAEKDSILAHFNDYMQSRQEGRTQCFIEGKDAYFRLEYTDSMPATSAGIAAFGNFLITSGYSVNGISSAKTLEGEEGTIVSFSREGKGESVVISTLNVY